MDAPRMKPFSIEKKLVYDAYKLVKTNAGAAGVDGQSLQDFDKRLMPNIYKVWNRMSSGSYFPPAVRAVPIPKKSGGQRILGVPTVADRIAQTVAKLRIEPILESIFLPDSYGYRPGKSALDAIGVTRKRCWKYEWVLEFDIRKLFDEIPHDLLMKAVRMHVKERWVILYIERWLKVPMQMEDGTVVPRERGTPQGGVISPLMANLFLHYCFDIWMERHFPQLPWCRYADDGLVHCRTLAEAEAVKAALDERLKECGLAMHPEKTRIVYCKECGRNLKYPTTKFDFLGYRFGPMTMKNQDGKLFTGFIPRVSSTSLKAMRQTIKAMHLRRHTEVELVDIAQKINPVVQGWIAYYGVYCPSALKPLGCYLNVTLLAWVMRKYKRFKGSKIEAGRFLEVIARKRPKLFVHWRLSLNGAFA